MSPLPVRSPTAGILGVAGITTLAAGAGNDITLDSAGNNFSTVGVASGRNVTLADANALDLGTSTVSGTLNVTTNGALTQSGALNVTGATTLSAGTANDITLNNASNNFSTVAVNSGNNVTLADADALNLRYLDRFSGSFECHHQWGPHAEWGSHGRRYHHACRWRGQRHHADERIERLRHGYSYQWTQCCVNGLPMLLDLGASTISGTLDVSVGGAVTSIGRAERHRQLQPLLPARVTTLPSATPPMILARSES